MGYNFNMDGCFKFNRKPPKKVLEILRTMNQDYELGESWYKENFNNDKIEAVWCPWCYDEDYNEIIPIDDANELNHNYWFIDWIAWIIESLCIPNDLVLNGSGDWQDSANTDYDSWGPIPEGNGVFKVSNNIIKVKGDFLGNDDWKKSIEFSNNLVKRRTYNGKIKGSFCVTGKVSISREKFKKIGLEKGYEFKTSVSKELTYLVCNDKDSTSTKIKNAIKNGIKVVTEEEFLKIIENNT